MNKTPRLHSYKASLSVQECIANYLRLCSWKTVSVAQSGHLGGPSSSTELVTALYFGGHLKIDLDNNKSGYRDRVMIRGHLAPLRYCLFNLFGWVENEELMHYRELGSRLQGHETMGLVSGIDTTPSGALGMVLSYGVGSALSARFRGKSYRTFVFLGDGEEQEGNVSEAARHAASIGLNNLICIIDCNGKQLSRPTRDVDLVDLSQIWTGYGWDVHEIADGHNLGEINSVYTEVFSSKIERPKVVIAHTIKGRGLPGASDNCCGYHTIHAIGVAELVEFVGGCSIPDSDTVKTVVSGIECIAYDLPEHSEEDEPSSFHILPDEYGPSLEDDLGKLFTHCASFMKRGYPLYVMTADLMPVSETKSYGLEGEGQYIDVGIREQHLFAMAHGISVADPDARILIMSHDAFLYRAADQIRAIDLGKSRVIVFGVYGGLGGNLNGDTHQSVGQIMTLIGMPNATIYEPADSQDFWAVANLSMANNPGLVYIRLYSKEAKPLPRLDNNHKHYRTHEPILPPSLVLVSTGLTAYDTYVAGQQLEIESIPTRVINVVDLKSVLSPEFANLIEIGVPILTIYNGDPIVLESLVSIAANRYCDIKPTRLEGHGFTRGTSGSMSALKKHFGLDSDGIVKKARQLLSQ